MDAVEFIVTRDRMCKYERERGINAKNEPCPGCCIPERLNIRTCPPCEDFIKQHPAEAVEIVERWGKEHPRKTRQSEFLKMFPNALIFKEILTINPCVIDSSRFSIEECHTYDDNNAGCFACRKKYWLEEVE